MAVVTAANSAHILYGDLPRHRWRKGQREHHRSNASTGGGGDSGGERRSFFAFGGGFAKEAGGENRRRGEVRVGAFWSRPVAVEMEPIADVEQLDLILRRAQELSQPVLVDWMANWCRKCIYLKPKLEKLAADFDNKLKFYYVDVNAVSQVLVKRGNISKMPTIQLWKDGEMKEEVIGGHQAWLVVEEVREMIQKHL